MKKKTVLSDITEESAFLGPELSFAASEAYKRLRTNLTFSFADQTKCRIIGITSSQRSEGKTTTAANLAYTYAEMGKHTLLIDGDMRLPKIHKLMKIRQTPGLSNLLVGDSDGTGLLYQSKLHQNLAVVTAGDIPPNPTELLSSDRMSGVLRSLCTKFDYIIMDLPPVGEVADALIVAPMMHGMVVVVRANYADKRSLDTCVQQLKYHHANIIGFVMNSAELKSKNKYYKKPYSSAN